MTRATRTLAAVLAGLALVAALPGPCACGPGRMASRHADEHACCAPPVGVRVVDRGCCDEAPAIATAVPAPAGPAAGATAAVVIVGAFAPFALGVPARPSTRSTPSLPPSVLRI
jgi:hypothetical protein